MVGHQAGHATTTGKFNTFIGDASGYANTTGGKNTFLGYSAGSANVSGSNNVFLGIYSGQYTKQSNKLIIDAIDRNDTTEIETLSLITGTFDAVAANQKLRFNGIPYIMGSLSDSIAASRGYAKAHGGGGTYTAGNRIGITAGDVIYNTSYWKNQDTVKNTLTGLLKATSGVLSVASAGTDYQAALTNPVTGTGTATTNNLQKATGVNSLGNSDIIADGTNTTFGTTTTGSNIVVNATEAADIAPSFLGTNWTATNGWSADGVGTQLTRVNNAAIGTITPSGSGATPSQYVTYKITIVASAISGAITYTYGGVTGTTITATTITDYITALTTDKLIISGAIASTATITSIVINPLTNGTGDVTVHGNLIVNSPIKTSGGLDAVSINKLSYVGIGTYNPISQLQVYNSFNGTRGIRISNPSTGSSAYSSLIFENNSSITAGGFFLNSSNNTGYSGAGTLSIGSISNVGMGLLTNNAVRLFISAAGNVGINQLVPASKLSIDGGNATAVALQLTNGTTTGQTVTDGSFYGSDASGNTTIIQKEANKYIDIMKNDTSVIRVAANKNVGIGTTAPRVKLKVVGDIESNNMIRAAGWLTGTGTGLGTEIGVDGSNSLLISYNRTTSAYSSLRIAGSTINIGHGNNDNLFINTTGNVGIGTTAPINKLTVVGGISADSIKVGNVHKNLVWDAKQSALTAKQIHDSLTVSATMKGSASTNGLRLNGSQKIVLDSANTTYGGAFTKFQYNKLQGATTLIGETNATSLTTRIGIGSGNVENETTQRYGVYIGYQAGYSTTTAIGNMFIGSQAGYSNITGTDNTIIGNFAGLSSLLNGNTFIGSFAGQHSTGADNVFIGNQCGVENTGSRNIFIGVPTITSYSTGNNNTVVGYDAGGTNTSGYNNTFIGYHSGIYNTTGGSNTFIGEQSGIANKSGVQNTFIGASVGTSHKYGSGNIFIGNQTRYYGVNYSNELVIDNQKRGSSANDSALVKTSALIYGTFNATVANQKVTVNGDFTYELRHCFLDNSADYTPAVTQNVYKKIQPTFTTVEADYMTVAGDTITITTAGDYYFVFNATIRGGAGEDFTTQIRKNNVSVKSVRQSTSGATSYFTYTVIWYFYGLVAGDDISLWITNTNSNDDPTISSQNIYMKKEHE
jgi:hypothetical protein